MGLNLNYRVAFSNPAVLTDLVNQATEQLKLKGTIKDSILTHGGLAYRLFDSRGIPDLEEFGDDRTLEKFCRVDHFIIKLQQYVRLAENIANKNGFELLVENGGMILAPFSASESDVYFAAIGSRKIESKEEFERFMIMIKDHVDELDRAYNGVLSQNQENK